MAKGVLKSFLIVASLLVTEKAFAQEPVQLFAGVGFGISPLPSFYRLATDETNLGYTVEVGLRKGRHGGHVYYFNSQNKKFDYVSISYSDYGLGYQYAFIKNAGLRISAITQFGMGRYSRYVDSFRPRSDIEDYYKLNLGLEAAYTYKFIEPHIQIQYSRLMFDSSHEDL